MHNLFLATVKRMFKLWTYSKLFSPSQLNEIEERIKSFEVPSDRTITDEDNEELWFICSRAVEELDTHLL